MLLDYGLVYTYVGVIAQCAHSQMLVKIVTSLETLNYRTCCPIHFE